MIKNGLRRTGRITWQKLKTSIDWKGARQKKTISIFYWPLVTGRQWNRRCLNPRDYWYKMKIRVKTEDGLELSTICRQLKLESRDGKKYATDCANTKNMFRIIQSIPSPKAEPFKQWLAQVGYERVQEIENPV